MNDAQKSIIDCKSGVSEMLRRLIQSVCGIILGITVAAQNLAAQQSASKCLPADAQSASFINELQRMMAATDSWTIQGRDNVFHVPVVSPSQVTLVTDAKTCDKASVAFGPPPGSTVLPT
ncbi:MAG TPA: hypothetical protein VFW66_05635, partial [Gemmatimonadales bacterium]|nr:hypothetical protein [Gemmatimonadales bacterium]